VGPRDRVVKSLLEAGDIFLRTRSNSLICSLAFATLIPAALPAQQAKVLAPHRPIPPKVVTRKMYPATPHSMVGGFWMMDANFKSSIYLRNNVETDPLTVTPVLWLSNGKKYVLPNVTLDPAGVAVININQALADKGVAFWATLSGYVEIQYTWPWDALCVTIENVDVTHSLILTYGLRPAAIPAFAAAVFPKPVSQVVEGLWWKHEENVTGFVALSSLSSEAMQAHVQVSDAQGNLIGTHSITLSARGTKIVNLPELQSVPATGRRHSHRLQRAGRNADRQRRTRRSGDRLFRRYAAECPAAAVGKDRVSYFC